MKFEVSDNSELLFLVLSYVLFDARWSREITSVWLNRFYLKYVRKSNSNVPDTFFLSNDVELKNLIRLNEFRIERLE